MELNMHLYVYKNDETVFDSLVEQRVSRMISIHPTTSKEYTEGSKFLKKYIEFNKINGDNHVGNYSKSIDLESEMFELYCSMIVDNSKYTGTGDGITDNFISALTRIYVANEDIRPVKGFRNDAAFRAFFKYGQNPDEDDHITFGSNPKGGFALFIQLDELGLIDLGMKDNFFYHYLSVYKNDLKSDDNEVIDLIMKKFKVSRVD